ncbi:prepilin peptidase [Lentilactobacillus kosonis]|uniref:Leader peptidase n=1 Tax=Lentilactobacillus kosonis TaxID=2810561 RepID=A0A401FLL8_9LACO|nr:A24 family peptidase [Lentilactobacillus kosonis]GAY73279.1 leader peptidase [Lentilactobacillus kosonis]
MEILKPIILFILGSSIASFLVVIVIRGQHCESILWPKSHCDSCNNSLTIIELIPIFNFIYLHGLCRYCKQSINPTSFISEIILGSLFASSIFYSTSIEMITISTWMLFLSLDDLNDTQVSRLALVSFIIICILFGKPPLATLTITLSIMIVLILINRQELFIGNADIEFGGALVLLIGLKLTLLAIFIACLLALSYIFLRHDCHLKLPFVPFLSVAYLITQQIESFIY